MRKYVPGLLLEGLAHLSRAEHVVAVLTFQPREAIVERAARAAIAVGDGHDVVAVGELARPHRRCAPDGCAAARAPGSRSRPNPAAWRSGARPAPARRTPRPPPGHSSRKRELVDEHVVEVGAPGQLDVLDLAQDRVGLGPLAHDSAAIFAPSPATLPADTIRGSAIFGTSPMRTALSGVRYAPKLPASSTCATSPGSTPSSRMRMFHPVAIEALAN